MPPQVYPVADNMLSRRRAASYLECCG